MTKEEQIDVPIEEHDKDCNCILCWEKAIKSIKFKNK